MEPGSHVWCRDPDPEGTDAWVHAFVVTKEDREITLRTKSDHIVTRPRLVEGSITQNNNGHGTQYDGVELSNEKSGYHDKAEVQNLIHLPHLNEPTMLHAIQERFYAQQIYTFTGPILIAVNPFQQLPLYTNGVLEAYRSHGKLHDCSYQRNPSLETKRQKLAPHVYSIADRSYHQMMRSKGSASQSILVSGESGSGKTETTKILMLYLATLGATDSPSRQNEGERPRYSSTVEKVLHSNPILEAFGNGKTLQNENSSRFGKLIELGFSRGGHLLGAKVQTYLLEKVRVGYHTIGERSYHIFYQLLCGLKKDSLKNYKLPKIDGMDMASLMHYTGQGGAPLLKEFTDENELTRTMNAMRNIGWQESKVEEVCMLAVGILHLGEVKFDFRNSGGEDITIIDAHTLPAVTNAADLLGVDEAMLKKALTERAVLIRGETITSPLSPTKATDARDAIARTIYGALFLWVTNQVNSCIGWQNHHEAVCSTISVLDLFGFECFSINSFEQLCINFANEALQQQFNKFIFQTEQQLYEMEKIQWEFIAFPDNQDCLDLIQLRPNGILPLLDDECNIGKFGSERNWVKRLYQTFIPKGNESEDGRFYAAEIQKVKSLFCIRHFAGSVTYAAETGFLEKNRDVMPLSAKAMFETAPGRLMKEVYEIEVKSKESQNNGAKSTKQKTVGAQFKDQLNLLIHRVESTEPHYIRCLKPNDKAQADLFIRKRVCEQLRYSGVLEAVRIARLGYPVRLDLVTFFKRYRILHSAAFSDGFPKILDEAAPSDYRILCSRLIELIITGKTNDMTPSGRPAAVVSRMQIQPPPLFLSSADIQPGLTKIFMRKAAYDTLEAYRTLRLVGSAILIQCFVRRIEMYHSYLALQLSSLLMQRVYRGFVGRNRCRCIQQENANKYMILFFRSVLEKKKVLLRNTSANTVQKVYRKVKVRKCLVFLQESKARELLKHFLRRLMRKIRYTKMLANLRRCREQASGSLLTLFIKRKLEIIRTHHRLKSAIVLQRFLRQYKESRFQQTKKMAAHMLQNACRGFLAREKIRNLRTCSSAAFIHACFRSKRQRRFFVLLLTASNVIQKAYRMFAAKSRHALRKKVEQAGALIIQFIREKYYFNEYHALVVGQLAYQPFLEITVAPRCHSEPRGSVSYSHHIGGYRLWKRIWKAVKTTFSTLLATAISCNGFSIRRLLINETLPFSSFYSRETRISSTLPASMENPATDESGIKECAVNVVCGTIEKNAEETVENIILSNAVECKTKNELFEQTPTMTDADIFSSFFLSEGSNDTPILPKRLFCNCLHCEAVALYSESHYRRKTSYVTLTATLTIFSFLTTFFLYSQCEAILMDLLKLKVAVYNEGIEIPDEILNSIENWRFLPSVAHAQYMLDA